MARLLLEEMTRAEANALAGEALLVFPVGALEQHGPHLPVGTDYFSVQHIARQAAGRAAGSIPVIVAPTLPFGSSPPHIPFGATMSVGTETYYRLLSDVLESLIKGGFRRFFIINGHGGNAELIQIVGRDLALKHPVDVAAGSYWSVAWERVVKAAEAMPGYLPGHAGVYETSQIMALRPELVPTDLPHRDPVAIPPRSASHPYRADFHDFWQRIDGYTDSPDQASAEAGRSYLVAVVEGVAQAFVDFWHATQRGHV
jgi:creatinine amidohydrolase